jgi:hypothetical protein
MQSIDEEHVSGVAEVPRRKLLLAVDDSGESERALLWIIDELYRFATCHTPLMLGFVGKILLTTEIGENLLDGSFCCLLTRRHLPLHHRLTPLQGGR